MVLSMLQFFIKLLLVLVLSRKSHQTQRPSSHPTSQPSQHPFNRPTQQPSGNPSKQPSVLPSKQPSTQPSSQPSRMPTLSNINVTVTVRKTLDENYNGTAAKDCLKNPCKHQTKKI